MKLKRSVFLLLLFFSFFMGSLAMYVADEITADDIRAAANLIGLEMTPAEIDSLLPGVIEAREDYLGNREKLPDNSVAPALIFNPVPPGYDLPQEQRPVKFAKAERGRLPENRDDLAWYSVRDLAELIRTRQVTSVELAEFFLKRLKTHDPTLHCVISYTEDLAMEQARRADRELEEGRYRGLLHGIPYGAKDLLATKNYKTTWGAMPYKDQVLDYDATVIQKLEEAGAVLIAKLTLGALAMGDVWYGERTRNPWDPETGSSGSSAGSASAVAAGLVPFAIGTETLGSIVSPSTTCGTTGLRPTFGRVSRHGAMALTWSMDKIGPIARTVEDCGIVLGAIYGPDGEDLSVIDVPFNYDTENDPKALRVGYLKSAFEGNDPFRAQDSIALEKMRSLGFELIPIELPELPNLRLILSAEAAAAFDELTLSGRDDLLVRQTLNAWPNAFREARFIPAVEYIQANRLRTQLMGEMKKLFEQIDVYIHPSWRNSSLQITNFTGHPCVVLPNGFRDDGRPSSITFTGDLFREGEVMAVARAYQMATDWHSRHPEGF